jgi:hypothetical protein
MANKSDWKGFEWLVAKALGGKRRFRTSESFSIEAPDVYFPKKVRKRYPMLRGVAIECKKRRALNVHGFFGEAVAKYGEGGKKKIVLASKIPMGRMNKVIKNFREKTIHQHSVIGPLWRNRIRKLKKQRKGKKIFKRDLKRINRTLQKQMKYKLKHGIAKIRARMAIRALVTVELGFFQELWQAWLAQGGKRGRQE